MCHLSPQQSRTLGGTSIFFLSPTEETVFLLESIKVFKPGPNTLPHTEDQDRHAPFHLKPPHKQANEVANLHS